MGRRWRLKRSRSKRSKASRDAAWESRELVLGGEGGLGRTKEEKGL